MKKLIYSILRILGIPHACRVKNRQRTHHLENYNYIFSYSRGRYKMFTKHQENEAENRASRQEEDFPYLFNIRQIKRIQKVVLSFLLALFFLSICLLLSGCATKGRVIDATNDSPSGYYGNQPEQDKPANSGSKNRNNNSYDFTK